MSDLKPTPKPVPQSTNDTARPATSATYEQQAEIMAINRLLEGKHFHNAVTIDSGHGYLYSLISQYADVMTLAATSDGETDNLTVGNSKLPYSDESVDLLIMVRSISRLQDPEPLLQELARVLKPEGVGIVEVANYARHRRLSQLRPRRGRHLKSPKAITADEGSAVAHEPKQIIRSLAHAGLKVERILSVSSLQGSGVKKLMPQRVLLAVEGLLQPALGKRYLGPSVFLAVRKLPPNV